MATTYETAGAAGSGSLSLELDQAGFNPLFVNELSPAALATYRTTQGGKVQGKGEPVTEHAYSHQKDAILAKFRAILASPTGTIRSSYRTKKFSGRLLRLHWDDGRSTTTANSLPADYVHLSHPRSLTIRELARLKMFPDWYQFAENRTTGGLPRTGSPREGLFAREVPKYTPKGSVVPVQLAFEFGKHPTHLRS